MSNVLGIDIGYGFTKTYQTATGKGIFPTLIVAPTGGGQGFGEQLQEIRVNGKVFYVGRDAETNLGWCIDTRTSSFVGSDAWLAVIGKVLSVNNIQPGDLHNGLKLVFGLPPGLFNRKAVSQLTDTIRKTPIQCDEQTYDLSRTDLKMIPQGAGIYYTYLMGNPEKEYEMKKTIAVVDIGHYTVDTVLFLPGGKYNDNVEGSVPLGISVLLDRVRAKFSQQHGRFINNDKALQLLMVDKIVIFQEEYTLEALDQLVESYSLQLNSHIEKFFDGEGGMSADLGLAAGGGILLAAKYLKAQKKKILVMASPDMANALGYWHYGIHNS